jgi:hypothetical protein
MATKKKPTTKKKSVKKKTKTPIMSVPMMELPGLLTARVELFAKEIGADQVLVVARNKGTVAHSVYKATPVDVIGLTEQARVHSRMKICDAIQASRRVDARRLTK